MLTNSTFDVSRLVIVSTPGTKSGSVEGPDFVKNLSKYNLWRYQCKVRIQY